MKSFTAVLMICVFASSNASLFKNEEKNVFGGLKAI